MTISWFGVRTWKKEIANKNNYQISVQLHRKYRYLDLNGINYTHTYCILHKQQTKNWQTEVQLHNQQCHLNQNVNIIIKLNYLLFMCWVNSSKANYRHSTVYM
jgi:hypothetical protein